MPDPIPSAVPPPPVVPPAVVEPVAAPTEPVAVAPPAPLPPPAEPVQRVNESEKKFNERRAAWGQEVRQWTAEKDAAEQDYLQRVTAIEQREQALQAANIVGFDDFERWARARGWNDEQIVKWFNDGLMKKMQGQPIAPTADAPVKELQARIDAMETQREQEAREMQEALAKADQEEVTHRRNAYYRELEREITSTPDADLFTVIPFALELDKEIQRYETTSGLDHRPVFARIAGEVKSRLLADLNEHGYFRVADGKVYDAAGKVTGSVHVGSEATPAPISPPAPAIPPAPHVPSPNPRVPPAPISISPSDRGPATSPVFGRKIRKEKSFADIFAEQYPNQG